MFYEAYLELSSCRQLGFVEGPIPWLAIHEYCKAHEIDGEQRDDLFFYVQSIDTAYLEWRAKKSKTEG